MTATTTRKARGGAPARREGRLGSPRRAALLGRDRDRRAARRGRLVHRARAGHGPGDHLLRGLATLAAARPRRGRLSAPARGRAGGPRRRARRARARGSGAGDRGRPRRRRPRRGLDRVPAPSGRPRPARALRGACSGARASPAGCATCGEPGSRSRPSLAAYWLVVPVAIGDPRHAPPARGRRARRSRAAVRGGDDPDERRPRPRRLVRPLAQRRRRDLVPDPAGEAPAGADARPPRLRRAPARRARLRRKRGRPEPVRLGRRQGHRRRRRLAAATAGRRATAASAGSASPSAAR